jgi:hypothetical protein
LKNAGGREQRAKGNLLITIMLPIQNKTLIWSILDLKIWIFGRMLLKYLINCLIIRTGRKRRDFTNLLSNLEPLQ